MVGMQHITITVRYEPRADHGTSLASIAPELSDARLALIHDHLNDPMPSRTWAGSVDERTFERFAESWRLPRDNEPGSAANVDDGENMAAYARTYDGMNWEVGGESPIISVSVQVGPDAGLGVSTETRASAPRRGSDRRTDSLRSPTSSADPDETLVECVMDELQPRAEPELCWICARYISTVRTDR